MSRLITPGGPPMSRFTKIAIIAACIFVLVTGFATDHYNKKAILARRTRETENKRVIDNAKRSIGHDVMKFVHAMGGSADIDIHAINDGKFVVAFPTLTVTKEQLEKYAAENVTWIEE